MSRSLLEAAAWSGLLGLSGMALLRAEDDLEVAVRLALVQRAAELEHERAKMWAAEIAHALGGRG